MRELNWLGFARSDNERNRKEPMNLTYMVRGADGKEYGPVSLEQLSAWIRDGRLRGEQEVKRSDMQHWASANAFEELRPMFGASTASPQPIAAAPTLETPKPQAAASLAHMKSGASWFYWVAVLSLVNSGAAAVGSSWRFIIGLGITQIIDVFGSNLGDRKSTRLNSSHVSESRMP